MVNDFGTTRYCNKCGEEIIREGDVVTWYVGKKQCECNKQSKDEPMEKSK